MASLAIPNINPLVTMPTDSYTVMVLKTGYNKMLNEIKTLVNVITDQENDLNSYLLQLNTTVNQLNDLATSIDMIQPSAQVSTQRLVSTLSITVSGEISLL